MSDTVSNTQITKSQRLANYSHVVEKARLRDVHVMNFSFEVKPIFWSDENKTLGYEVESDAVQFDEERGLAVAFIVFSVQAKSKRKKCMTCKATYSVVYDNLSACDTEAVEAFLKRVATFASYPYFRGLFASMDWAAGLRLPPLPIHKEPEKVRTVEAAAGADR